MTQQEVADRLGIHKQTVSQYERAVRKPSFEMIEKLADLFNVDLNYLLGFTDHVTRLSGDQTDPADSSGAYVKATTEELQLLRAYRHTTPEIQTAIKAILRL